MGVGKGNAPGSRAALAKSGAQPGNERGLGPGYRRKVSKPPGEDAARDLIRTHLGDRVPVRGGDGGPELADEPLIDLTAREWARYAEADDYLAKHGVLDANGEVRPAAEFLLRAGKRLAELLDRLGMSPRSRAALGVDLARTVDLATAMSEPDAERRQELLRQAGVLDA